MGALWHSNSSKLAVPDTAVEDAPSPAPRHRGRRYGWMALGVLLLIALVVLGFAIEKEVRTSRLQALEFSRFAAALNYSMHAGASDSMLYPGAGPFDKRLGYSSLGDFLPRLLKRDYVIAEQTRFSPELLSYSKKGFFRPLLGKDSGRTLHHGLLGSTAVPLQLPAAAVFRLRQHPARGGAEFAVH